MAASRTEPASSPRQRQGRRPKKSSSSPPDQSAAPELNRDRIAKAALSIADDRGVGGFTMQAVADALGVTPMALYHYVKDKAALVALLMEVAITEHPLPAPTGLWQEDLLEMAHWTRRQRLAHPALGDLSRLYRVWTPAIFPMLERWISIWQQSELPFERAMLAAATSSNAVIGLVDGEMVLRELGPPEDELLHLAPNARHVFHRGSDPEYEFDLLVRSLIDGLCRNLAGEDGRTVHKAEDHGIE